MRTSPPRTRSGTGSGRSTSAASCWPASMNATTSSAHESAAACAFRGVQRYGHGHHRRSTRQRALRHPAGAALEPAARHPARPPRSFNECYLCSRLLTPNLATGTTRCLASWRRRSGRRPCPFQNCESLAGSALPSCRTRRTRSSLGLTFNQVYRHDHEPASPADLGNDYHRCTVNGLSLHQIFPFTTLPVSLSFHDTTGQQAPLDIAAAFASARGCVRTPPPPCVNLCRHNAPDNPRRLSNAKPASGSSGSSTLECHRSRSRRNRRAP